MVFEKYIKKEGKNYGPYPYEDKRVGRKIVTRYAGRPGSNSRIWIYSFLLVFLFFLLSGVTSAAHGFELNNLILKISVKSGDIVNKTLSLSASNIVSDSGNLSPGVREEFRRSM